MGGSSGTRMHNAWFQRVTEIRSDRGAGAGEGSARPSKSITGIHAPGLVPHGVKKLGVIATYKVEPYNTVSPGEYDVNPFHPRKKFVTAAGDTCGAGAGIADDQSTTARPVHSTFSTT